MQENFRWKPNNRKKVWGEDGEGLRALGDTSDQRIKLLFITPFYEGFDI